MLYTLRKFQTLKRNTALQNIAYLLTWLPDWHLNPEQIWVIWVAFSKETHKSITIGCNNFILPSLQNTLDYLNRVIRQESEAAMREEHYRCFVFLVTCVDLNLMCSSAQLYSILILCSCLSRCLYTHFSSCSSSENQGANQDWWVERQSHS